MSVSEPLKNVYLKPLLALAALTVTGTLLLTAQPPGGLGKGKQKAKGPEPCERACLEDFGKQYLDALAAHNAFGLPLAKGVTFTENGYVVPLGDGLWNLVTGIGRYRIYITDPLTQQVGMLATLYENQRPVTLALRLKIVDRKITEIETMVSRIASPITGPGGPGAAKGKGPGDAKGKGIPPRPAGAANLELMFGPSSDFITAAPEGQRVSRERLEAAANAYFDGMERGDGSTVPFAAQCDRIEDGVRVTNNPGPAPASRGTIDTVTMSCAAQLSSKAFASFQTIYPRRYPVIDEERQLVMAWAMYQQPGNLLTVTSPGIGNVDLPAAATQPAFVHTVQIFKMENGLIRRMEGLTQTLPYGTRDPYFGDDWRKQ